MKVPPNNSLLPGSDYIFIPFLFLRVVLPAIPIVAALLIRHLQGFQRLARLLQRRWNDALCCPFEFSRLVGNRNIGIVAIQIQDASRDMMEDMMDDMMEDGCTDKVQAMASLDLLFRLVCNKANFPRTPLGALPNGA